METRSASGFWSCFASSSREAPASAASVATMTGEIPPTRRSPLAETELVAPTRLERVAYGLGNRRSIHLSYGASETEGASDTAYARALQGTRPWIGDTVAASARIRP
jgi:hypothetical protein